MWAQVIGNLLVGILMTKGISDSVLFIVLTCVAGASLIGFIFVKYALALSYCFLLTLSIDHMKARAGVQCQ